MRSWRSLLFVPAHDEARTAKAFERGADAVILDLEDGVPESAKQMARQALPALAGAATAPALVRINNRVDLLDADLAAISCSNVAAVMIPKVESADIIADVAAKLSRGGGSIGIVALIETPLAVEQLGEIATAPGLSALALGVEDLAAALGAPPNPENLDLPCRLLAFSAAARGLAAFGAPTSLSTFDQPEAFEQACRRGRLMGLHGALCIHPAQVAAANVGFAPSELEIAQARAVIAAWREGGGGGVVRLSGRMIDAPLVRQAEIVLERARQ